jgi:hypothetical protein
MADITRDSSKTKVVRDWVNRRPDPPTAEQREKRRRLQEALTNFIHSQGAWVTSPPGARCLRVEIVQNSSLPAKLIELGYNPRHCGTSTRIVSGGTTETTTDRRTGNQIIRHHDGIVPIDIIELEIPGR